MQTGQITKVLERLSIGAPEIVGAALVKPDGSVISSVTRGDVVAETVAGQAASLLDAGRRIATELMQAPLEEAYVKTDKGSIVLCAVGDRATLTLLLTGDANMGLILLELKRAVPQLTRLL